jgi:hypothetical protein
MNSRSPVGVVSQQWDTVDWACVLCDRHIHNDRASRSASSRQCACLFYSSCAGFFWQSITSPRSVSPPYSPNLAPCNFWLFPKLKLPLKGRFVNATVAQYTSSVNSVSLLTDQPHRRVTVHGRAVRSTLTGCQVTSRPRDWFSRYSKWLGTFQTALVTALLSLSGYKKHDILKKTPSDCKLKKYWQLQSYWP